MPIDKLEKPRLTDVDPTSITLDLNLNRKLSCYKCGHSDRTLKRVRDDEGNKVRPAKYICTRCA